MSRTYWVYMLSSRTRNLYAGVTNDLQRRMIEHREGLVSGFTSRYRIFRLVHFESFADIRDAIAREKEIKGWRREKKIWLIERKNPTWQDLAEEFAPTKSARRKDVPHRNRFLDEKTNEIASYLTLTYLRSRCGPTSAA